MATVFAGKDPKNAADPKMRHESVLEAYPGTPVFAGKGKSSDANPSVSKLVRRAKDRHPIKTWFDE